MIIVSGLGKMIRLDTLSHENRARSKSDYFARGKNAWIFTSEQTKTADFIAKCLFRGKICDFLPLRINIRPNIRVPIGSR